MEAELREILRQERLRTLREQFSDAQEMLDAIERQMPRAYGAALDKLLETQGRLLAVESNIVGVIEGINAEPIADESPAMAVAS